MTATADHTTAPAVLTAGDAYEAAIRAEVEATAMRELHEADAAAARKRAHAMSAASVDHGVGSAAETRGIAAWMVCHQREDAARLARDAQGAAANARHQAEVAYRRAMADAR